MNWIHRHLAPFVEERQRQGWRGLAWAALLLLAPVAWVAAVVLGSRLPNGDLRFIKPPEMMARATAVARDFGTDVTGWSSIMTTAFSNNLAPYLEDARYQRLPADQKRFAPLSSTRVVFFETAKSHWIDITLRPDGSLLGIRLSDNLTPSPRGSTEEEARQLAAEQLAQHLAPPAALGLRQPELLPGDGASTRRFQWIGRFQELPEFRPVFIVDVRGDRVVALREDFSVDAAVVARRNPVWWKTFGMFRALLALTLAAYGIYRFARRSMEKEVAYGRCLILFLGIFSLLAAIYVLHPGLNLGGLPPEQFTTGILALQLMASLVFTAVNAILTALIYGGTEGELREIYPGKLTALDALLTGRWFSANVGRAVVLGITAAGWALLLNMAGEHLFASRIPHMLGSQVNLTYTAHGWLTLLLQEPMLAMFLCVFSLLLPLIFVNRNIADRRPRVWLIVGLAFCGAMVSSEIDIPYPWIFLRVAIAAALVLIAFSVGDLLSALVAANLFVVGYSVSLLTPLGGDWPGVVRYVVIVTVFTALVAVQAAYRGKDLSDEEVRPQYAERMLQRLGLQAEVSAARDAQLRLLPAQPPDIPGLQLAASCKPAKEVGGDFYDFFPLRHGGLGVLVAEGGSTGLASALSIGLAKGFLLYAAERHWPAGDALRKLRPVLLRAVKGNIERLGLAYVTIDPQGACRVARFGTYPKLFELNAGQPPREVELLSVAEADFVAERSFRMAEHGLLLIATDGLLERIRQRSGKDLGTWLSAQPKANAASLHGALLGEVGADFDDDITVVLVERQEPALGLREGVA